MSAFNALAWLHDHNATVLFQYVLPTDRSKNKVVVSFTAFNTRRSVGGFSLIHATQKASIEFDIAKNAYEKK